MAIGDRSRLLVWLAAVILAATSTPAGAGEPDPGRVREAVVRGLRLVEKAAESYPEHRGCFSCHHQTLPMQAMSIAAERAVPFDREVLSRQARFTHRSFAQRSDEMLSGKGVGGASLTVGYGLWALDLGRWKPDETTTVMVSYLLGKQRKDGSWRRSTSRPPLEDSNVTCTVLAAQFMRKYASPEQRQDVEAAATRARAWLRTVSPVSQEDRNSLLGGLALLGAPPAELAAARDAVIAAQRADGGWGQLDDMPSDAYATGQTLFTLQRTGTPVTDPAFRRGLRFLLSTQLEDGSWHVKSRSKPIQRLFDNGDPHGTDQFISTPATSWATAALALSLPRVRRARF